MLVKPVALAYYNHGRWIADCPEDCGSAADLDPRRGVYHCSACQCITKVIWPHNADDITETLSVRPKRNRNWYPANHLLALRFGIPHGQTVDELIEETEVHRGLDESDYIH